MNLKDTILHYRMEILLLAILLLSAILDIWNIWIGGFSNLYYAAAVKSALVNPAAGFFGSLDPAGFITVDKPPVGIWVQALFAAGIGFSGWSIILPQALAGIGSVALIDIIVSRPFGRSAGLVAALALATTPIFVAVARNGTMDMQMIFVILLAVWAALKAGRERSLPWLLASVVLVGVGFNIKMIQAFIVVPAILVVYLLGTKDLAWKARVLPIALAIVVLLAVSLSWAVVVDSIPAGQRPFIGGSDDNTVIGLIINYNGAHRLGIGTSGGGAGSGSSGLSAGGMPGPGSGNLTPAPGNQPGFPSSGSDSEAFASAAGPGGMAGPGQDQQTPPGVQQSGSAGPQGGGPGGMGSGFGGGNPGLFRLFQSDLAGDIVWLLPFALIGVIAWVRRPATLTPAGTGGAGCFGEPGITLLAMLLWLVPGLLYFSFTSGFWHDYYIATLAPPLAALVGIGAAEMYRAYVSGSRAGWLVIIAVPATGLMEAAFLSGTAGAAGALAPFIAAGTLATTGVLAFLRVRKIGLRENHRGHIAVLAIAILFIAPFAWSCTLLGENTGNIPTAALSGSQGGMGRGSGSGLPGGGSGFGGVPGTGGPGTDGMTGISSYEGGPGWLGSGATALTVPEGSAGNRTPGGSLMDGGPGGMGSSGSTGQLAEFLPAHTTSETWILAVPDSHEGAELIIRTGKAVMCLGGFTGQDQFLNATTIQPYIREGKVRFFLIGSDTGTVGGRSGSSSVGSWVSKHCTSVNLSGSAGSGGGPSSALYDCKGYSGLAAS